MARGKSAHDSKLLDLENQLKRALADYANLQKRQQEEKEKTQEFAKAAVLAKFLSILDSLEAAERASSSDDKGLALAIAQFKKVLAEEEVAEVPTDKGFDPLFHEAVEMVNGEVDNQIIEVAAKGYLLGDRLLRPARVKVAKKEI